MNKKLFIGLLLTVACSSFVSAQKEWSLEECITYALDKNIQIKRQELVSDIRNEQLKQSYFQVLPNLNSGWSHNYKFGKSENTSTHSWVNNNFQNGSMYVSSELVLFNGLQNLNTIKQYRLNMLKSMEDLNKARNDVSLYVATAYLDILFNMELLEIAKAQLVVTNLQVDKTQKMVDVGNKAKGDLLQIQAQAANENYAVVNAENNLHTSLITLAQLLEIDSVNTFVIRKPDIIGIEAANVLLTVDSIYGDAVVNLPQIKSAEYNLGSYQKGVNLAYGQLSPYVSLSGSVSSWYNETDPDNYSKQIDNNLAKQLSFGVTIPIFNRMTVKRNISVAKLQVRDAEYNLFQEKKTLYKEIQQAHAAALAALAQYNSATEAVASNEESFKYTQQKYDVGLENIVNYNLAKNNLIKAKSDQLQAKYNYIFKTKILDFYRGKQITLK
jgi:outer membrane protein